ncbi:hypothetical protein B0H13DRAFT_2369990 [Mycena leptocephala]|nr:hypothetical protein B0H13DRAFT_2369990 [Mycena leptocephala]
MSLDGSSKEHPWTLDEAGELVLQGVLARLTVKRDSGLSTKGHHHPSTHDFWVARGSPTAEQHRQNYLRRLKIDLESLEFRERGKTLASNSQASPRQSVPSVFRRRRRERPIHHPKPAAKPLTHEDLWLDNVRPPVDVAPNYEHKCGICLGIKSHPVRYGVRA